MIIIIMSLIRLILFVIDLAVVVVFQHHVLVLIRLVLALLLMFTSIVFIPQLRRLLLLDAAPTVFKSGFIIGCSFFRLFFHHIRVHHFLINIVGLKAIINASSFKLMLRLVGLDGIVCGVDLAAVARMAGPEQVSCCGHPE